MHECIRLRPPGYDRRVAATEGPKLSDLPDVDPTTEQPHASALPERRPTSSAQLPVAADVRKRNLLGIAIAMTDYEQAMDVMDGMIDRRERGYICAVAVHALTVGYTDAE